MKKIQNAQGIFAACKPRKEVLEGELDDAIFAADFGHLIAGTAPKVYNDAATFIRNTEPTPDLKAICATVFRALAEKKEGGQLLRLSTGFGGGKTHTLMALWHLANNIGNLSFGTDLLPAAGRPKEIKVIAIDGGKAGIPVFATHGKTTVRSLQGEIFWQMGEGAALKTLGAADHHEACPEEKMIEKILGRGPLLILLDELVIYMASLSPQGQGNLMSFLGKLISVVTHRPQTVLVITDPGQQTSYADITAELASKLPATALKMDDILGRKMTDFDPIGKQAAKVIARRLFEKIDATAAAKTSDDYHNLYSRVREAHPELLPAEAASADYAHSIAQCYPFHPRLIKTVKDHLGPLPEFQRSRGVLRLFARIVRDIWDRETPLDLITAGDINWGSSSIRADLLQRLRREQFVSAVDADVEGHALELDDAVAGGLHYRAASALLLESLPRTDSSGLDGPELTLAVLRTEDAGNEPAEALDRLVGHCWHTYPTSGGQKWQFRFEPNVIKQIEQRAATVELQDAKERVSSEVQGYFKGLTFSLASWPDRPKDVRELKDLQLALCVDVATAEQVCAHTDTTDPAAPIPRRYRNAIVAIAPAPAMFDSAVERARRLIAAEQIDEGSKHGESRALVRDQLLRIMPNLQREFGIQARRAFDTVVRGDGVVGRLEEKHQVPDDEILAKPRGQSCLQTFLEDKEMIYSTKKVLDPERFMKNALPGTTPIPDQPQVYRLSDVHERLLGAPNLRLIPNDNVVRQIIIGAVLKGKVVVRLADGTTYDADGAVVGPPDARHRVESMIDKSATLQLTSDNLLAVAGSEAASEWLAVTSTTKKKEKKKKKGEEEEQEDEKKQAEPLERQATGWGEILEGIEKYPLVARLTLTAGTPAVAETLASVVQPFGADRIELTLVMNGSLKSGGQAGLSVEKVKINAPFKPLELARTLFNAMEAGMLYEAVVELHFKEPGREGLLDALRAAEENADDEIKVSALLRRPGGTS